MKKISILSALILMFASALVVSCETPDNEQVQENKTELGDKDGNLPIKPRPPVNPPVGPKK